MRVISKLRTAALDLIKHFLQTRPRSDQSLPTEFAFILIMEHYGPCKRSCCLCMSAFAA